MACLIVTEEPPMPAAWDKAACRAAKEMAKAIDKEIIDDITKNADMGHK